MSNMGKKTDREAPEHVAPVAAADVMRRVGQSQTLAELVIDRGASPVTSLSAFYWIAAWGLFHDANGREPRSLEEVAEAIGLPVSSMYRWQRVFRKLFPEYSTPATLWALVHDQVPGDDPKVMGLQLGAAEL